MRRDIFLKVQGLEPESFDAAFYMESSLHTENRAVTFAEACAAPFVFLFRRHFCFLLFCRPFHFSAVLALSSAAFCNILHSYRLLKPGGRLVAMEYALALLF